MLLLTGPPGSGKTQLLLDHVREAARRGSTDTRLLTPTATMAEHLRHELARQEGAIPSGLVETLHRFLAGFPTRFQPASRTLLEYVVRQALQPGAIPEFDDVAAFPGFQSVVADLVNELSGAGVQSHQLDRLFSSSGDAPLYGKALTALLARVEDALLERSRLTRGDYLRAVGLRIKDDGIAGVRHVLLDGFFTFNRAELDLIRAIAEHADITVALPAWSGCGQAREALLRLGFEEKILSPVRPRPAYEIVRAENRDAEVTEVARRILEESKTGRPFREMGVVVRSSSPYGPALENALGRFGIPARLYFGHSLAGCPPVRRLMRVMDACLKAWDLETLLGAIRLGPASARRDRLDFSLRKRIPDRGLDVLEEFAATAGIDRLLSRLRRIDRWREQPAEPSIWRQRFAGLAGLFPDPAPRDAVSPETALTWRIHTAALEGYTQAVEVAATLPAADAGLSLEAAWEVCRWVLERQRLYVRDRRRDVVHIIDAYEARQWELPVVFVCGLVEEEFPQRHSDNPLIPDDARRALRKRGVVLKTTAEAEREEQFLFRLAVTRGVEKAILSYPAHNAIGDPNLPAFPLAELRASLGRNPDEDARPPLVLPASRRSRAVCPPPRIYSEDLLAELANRHARLSPSSIERFLSCPFEFFAEKTLRLEEPPPLPADRLDALLQGSIVHEVLALAGLSETNLAGTFNRIFEQRTRANNVPPGYQRESVRLEMLRSLERWLGTDPLPRADEVRVEAVFEMEIAPGLVIRGRADRIDVHSDRRAFIVDYKYSVSDRLREFIKGSEEGRRVQAGLYMAAARDHFKLTPVGMFYSAVRKKPGWAGWYLDGETDIGDGFKNCTESEFSGLIAGAVNVSIEAFGKIRGGVIDPAPADDKACDYCAGKDICRRGDLGEAVRAGGGAS